MGGRACRKTRATWWRRCLSASTNGCSPDRDEYLRTEPNQIVVDYISSMTDRYFTALYAHLFPDDSRRPIERGYCADLG